MEGEVKTHTSTLVKGFDLLYKQVTRCAPELTCWNFTLLPAAACLLQQLQEVKSRLEHVLKLIYVPCCLRQPVSHPWISKLLGWLHKFSADLRIVPIKEFPASATPSFWASRQWQ